MTTTRARGLDLSQVQGRCDFARIAAAGYDWVTLKATEGGTYTDPTWDWNVRGAKDAGLLVDAYHYITTGSPVAQQIAHFANVAFGILDLPPSVDFEAPTPEHWQPPNTGDALTRRALEAVKLTEQSFGPKRVSVYSFPFFMASLPHTPELVELVTYALWIASYKNEKIEPLDADQPVVPAPWMAWSFWQWSGNNGLAAPGVPCVVDHDVFNGTRAELLALCLPTSESGPAADSLAPVST